MHGNHPELRVLGSPDHDLIVFEIDIAPSDAMEFGSAQTGVSQDRHYKPGIFALTLDNLEPRHNLCATVVSAVLTAIELRHCRCLLSVYFVYSMCGRFASSLRPTLNIHR